jgi:hypothetical protein
LKGTVARNRTGLSLSVRLLLLSQTISRVEDVSC